MVVEEYKKKLWFLAEKEIRKNKSETRLGRKKAKVFSGLIGNMVVKSDTGVWRWKKGRLRKYRHDVKRTLRFKVDIEANRDCIGRACNSTWWNWCGGSRPFFWR